MVGQSLRPSDIASEVAVLGPAEDEQRTMPADAAINFGCYVVL
jgi:hypothetical protein